MDTNELIDTLVARHRAVDRHWIEQTTALAVTAGLMLSFALVGVVLGFRGDIGVAIEQGRLTPKLAYVSLVVILSVVQFLRIARPGRRLLHWAVVFMVPALLIIVLTVMDLQKFAPEQWPAMMLGRNATACVILLPLLSMAPLALLIGVLRRCAPTDLRRAGFVAGVLATAVTALAYAGHCTDDAPGFVALWYTLAFGIGGVIGARVVPAFVRW